MLRGPHFSLLKFPTSQISLIYSESFYAHKPSFLFSEFLLGQVDVH